MYCTKIREIIGSILAKETPNEETIESFVSLLEILSSVVAFSEELESLQEESVQQLKGSLTMKIFV